MKKFVITGINISVDSCSHEYLNALVVKDSNNNHCNIDVHNYTEIEDMSPDEQVAWGRAQIGRTLCVESLKPISYSAEGKIHLE